jgi:hypothetical protein
MPGVLRPMTLVDVIATVYGQAQSASAAASAQGASVVGIGIVAETDESTAGADSYAALVPAATLGWDQEVYGALPWH